MWQHWVIFSPHKKAFLLVARAFFLSPDCQVLPKLKIKITIDALLVTTAIHVIIWR
jgi:hypothetical protein